MLIRYGYDITVNCSQPTPIVCFLSVHEDWAANRRSEETLITKPEVSSTNYRDQFGNVGLRFVAPAGDFSIWCDGTIEDEGAPTRSFRMPLKSPSKTYQTIA